MSKDKTKKTFALISGTLLLAAGVWIYRGAFPELDKDATVLSAIVLIGLALTVIFMAVLGIIYSVMGIENKDQPLGLPEGSVRALLAFSLVLIFVCLAAFLFSEVNGKPCEHCAVSAALMNETQLLEVKTNNLVVASEQAKDPNNKLMYEQIADQTKPGQLTDDPKHPLYRVTYYPRPSKDAVDFAKQIFTTLATIFVSVVSFYFGSSVTTSAARAGAEAVQGSVRDKGTADLTTALANVHAAEIKRDKARATLAALPATAPQAEQDAAHQAVDDAEAELKAKQAVVASKHQDVKG